MSLVGNGDVNINNIFNSIKEDIQSINDFKKKYSELCNDVEYKKFINTLGKDVNDCILNEYSELDKIIEQIENDMIVDTKKNDLLDI